MKPDAFEEKATARPVGVVVRRTTTRWARAHDSAVFSRDEQDTNADSGLACAVEVDMLRCSFRSIAGARVSARHHAHVFGCAAQSAVEPWTGLKTSDLDTIYVRDVNGAEMSGKLLQLNPDSLVLLVGGVERRFDLPEVSRIQKRDSLKNGTRHRRCHRDHDGRACRRNVGLSRRRTGWQLRRASCHCRLRCR